MTTEAQNRESNRNKIPDKKEEIKQRETIERDVFKRDFEDRKSREKD